MSHVKIDETLCTGCGLCAANNPEYFEIGDNSIARVVAGASLADNAQDIVDQCPLSAMSVI